MNRPRTTRWMAAFATAALTIAACSSDDDTTEDTAEDTAAEAPATDADGVVSVPDTEAEPAPTADDGGSDDETDGGASEAEAPPPEEPPPTDPPETTTTEPPPPAPAMPESYVGYVSETYTDDARWMCRAGAGRAGTDDSGAPGDVCDRDLDVTAVFADGTTEVRPHERADDPGLDCFYVYPTVSLDETENSDFEAAEGEEVFTTLNQAARLTSVCDVYAPVYRQVTLTVLAGAAERTDEGGATAYGDVVDAFRHFIANDNVAADGSSRPFVVIGHSQGAGHLARLVGDEIDGEPLLRDRMLSAILLGTSVAPDQFDDVAACTASDDLGCVLSYSSYRDTVPPVDGAIFGRTGDGPAICVNPAGATTGDAVAQPVFSMSPEGVLGPGAQPFDDPERSAEITTPYVTYPDMITMRCRDDGSYGWLELEITTADGPRVDDIGGDLTPEWGMHIVDANVAMGDLVDFVGDQAAAFAATGDDPDAAPEDDDEVESTDEPRRYDFSAIAPIVDDYVASEGIEGAGLIVVERDDGVVYEHHAGSFSPDRISLIASASKSVVAIVLNHLADEGLLDMDQPVAELTGWEGNPDITPAQLVSNSSGLVGLGPDPGYAPYLCQFLPDGTLQDCAESIFTTPDDDGDVIPPDTEFRYGGAQWQVAGAVAEIVSGRPWSELLDDVLVEPCGLEGFGFNNHFGQLPGGFEHPDGFDGDPSVLRDTDNPNMEGGAYSTTGAYGQLLLMQLRDGRCGDTQILSAESLDRLHGDRIGEVYGGDSGAPDSGYGMGWWVDRSSGRITDPGAYGAFPWLDLEDGYGAYLVVEETSPVGGRLADRLFDPIDEAILAAR